MTQSTRRPRSVVLDPDVLKSFLARTSWSVEYFVQRAGISRRTWERATRHANVRVRSVKKMAKAFGLSDFEPLLMRSRTMERPDRDYGPQGNEWTAEALTPFQLASSHLFQYRICRMSHRHIPGRLGRGKWYELLHENVETRQRLKNNLIRHPVVCERIGLHPNVSENLSTSLGPNDCEWWVIDRHVEGRYLDQILTDGPIAQEGLRRLMRDLATGVEALHLAGVVFRELAPSRVIIADDDGRAVLTDFELAKLMEPVPTVSAEWHKDPYRAPEVGISEVDERADLYSWARILVHAANGELPGHGEDLDLLRESPIPKRVWSIAADCLSPFPDERPKDIQKVIKALQSWK